MGLRETGSIEGLFHSRCYGFIQCCDRQASLFFHFSSFAGNTKHLEIGDHVEFELTYDHYGRPIASTVGKIAPEEVMNEEREVVTSDIVMATSTIKEERVGARTPEDRAWKRKAGEEEAGRAGKVGRFQVSDTGDQKCPG